MRIRSRVWPFRIPSDISLLSVGREDLDVELKRWNECNKVDGLRMNKNKSVTLMIRREINEKEPKRSQLWKMDKRG